MPPASVYSGVTYAPGDPPVDQEGRRRHEGRVIGGEKGGGGGDLARLPETAHGDVHQAPGGPLGIFGEELLEQRRVHGAGTERVHPYPLPGELDAELSRTWPGRPPCWPCS